MSDPFTLPIDTDRLFGTFEMIPASLVREYKPILNGELMAHYAENTDNVLEDIKTVKWELCENYFPESVYTARIQYQTEEWVTNPEGNVFYYRIDPEKMFNLPLGIEITTIISRLVVNNRFTVTLPRETTIRLTGDTDTLMLYRLTF